MSNVFAVEPLLIARLQANVPGLEEVASVSKLAGYRADQIPLPSIYVLPDVAEVEGDPYDGAAQIEQQTWQVIVCVSHLDTASAAQIAGPLLYQAIQSLVGWRPASGFLPFAYRGRLEPYYEPGYAEFPALVSTGLVITGI